MAPTRSNFITDKKKKSSFEQDFQLDKIISSTHNMVSSESEEKRQLEINQQKESFLTKFRRIITVEPLLVIYNTSFQAGLPIQAQFVYRNLLKAYGNTTSFAYDMSLLSNDSNEPSSASCGNYTTGGMGQAKAQASAAMLAIVFGLCTIIPGIFSTMLLGSFSDRAGRKWGMIPPLVGDIFKTSLVMCIIIFDLPFWQLLIVGCLIQGFCGNAMLVNNACFAYIADISTRDHRMFRIFIVQMLIGFSDLAGNLIIGNLIAAIGFLYSYLFLLCLSIVCLLYSTLILEETVQRKPNAKLCSFDNYVKVGKFYARGDIPGRRPMLLISLLIFLFTTMIEQGANGTALDLYLMNVPLCWQSIALGYYRAFLVVVHFSFDLFAIKILLPHLKAGGLLLFGCVSLIAYDLFLAQVVAPWMAYLAIVASFATGMILTMMRGMTSQLAEPHEQGSLFAGQGIAILLSSLSGIIMYNVVYSRTVTTFSRTIFYVAAGQGVITFFFACFLVWNVKKHEKTAESETKDVRPEDTTTDMQESIERTRF